MSSSFEKSVKGATKVKLAPPKSKYVEHILLATQSGDAGVAEIFRTLTLRLRDSTWTVAFKSLIVIHLMIKEGARDVTLAYLSMSPENRLAVNTFTDVQTQGQNIRRYSEYLLARAEAFASTQCDYVRSGEGRMKRLTVNKRLLRETEVVQDQVKALVKCDFLTLDAENEISLTAFRLLTRDLLDLFNVQNEAMMNVLSHYFEMSRPDAERAIKIYKRFCSQTDLVVKFLSMARQYEHATRLQIPKIRHAPTGLAKSLQEYLDDKDFETNRSQYLAEQESRQGGKSFKKESETNTQPAPSETTSRPPETAPANPPPKGPAPDLIDFFASIEANQQPMAQNTQPFQPVQQTGFVEQQQPVFQMQQPQQGAFQQQGFAAGNTNPFLQQQPQQIPLPQPQTQTQPQPLQTQFTGAGFGGFGPQPPQQQQQFVGEPAFSPQQHQHLQQPPMQTFTSPVQNQSPMSLQSQQTGQQSTNPFRQSMMPTATESMTFNSMTTSPMSQQSTNPFTRDTSIPPVPPIPGNAFAQQQQQQLQPLQVQPTGTNPFARNITPSQQTPAPPNPLQVQPTGSTNPFRQSMFVNQQTGAGWQHSQQGTMGGLENLPTVPIFPRPGQAPTQQQQSPWG